MPDNPIKITRSAGSNWPTRFGPGAATSLDVSHPDDIARAVSNTVQNIAPGNQNIAPGPMNNISDVAITNVQNGDVLRYENRKWRNYNETNLTDGGNF